MSSDDTLTWRQLLEQTSEVLGRPQARWVCEEASGCFGQDFLDEIDQPATTRCVSHLDAMVARIRTGEPLQYVLGHWSFRELDLMVDPRVLIPRPETELIVDYVLKHIRDLNRRPVVVDMGTGSGAIGLSVAMEMPRDAVDVLLTDVSEDALSVARANAAGLGLKAARVSLRSGDWFAALATDLAGAIDVIVANPPYIAEGDPEVQAEVHASEPHYALYSGPNGLDAIAILVEGAPLWLRAGGKLILEIGYKQADEVTKLAERFGYATVTVHQDLAGRDRFVVATTKD